MDLKNCKADMTAQRYCNYFTEDVKRCFTNVFNEPFYKSFEQDSIIFASFNADSNMKSIYLFFTKSKKRACLLVTVWTLFIFFACLIPGRDVPEVSIPLIDKWVHFIIFGGFAFLWLATFKNTNLWKRIAIFLLAVLTGYIVELLQGSGITSGRSYDLMDVLADGIGGALGVGIFYLLDKKYHQHL